ncbi:MAG TPA: FtsX-like permease family protein, partial [Gemmatimonadaceae bacterium]|nr:FtsX-like permease family protein [Gemmatimonadaceae bacterium]
MVGSVRQPLLLFFAAVALVLLIACANVANLLLARGTTRGREMAIRSAMGGSRVRIVRALLLESLLLAVVGAALGLMLGEWLTMGFKAFAPPGIPRIDDVRTDATVMLFATSLAVVTCVLFGLVPALRASRVDLVHALREGGRGLSGRAGRLGRVLVIAELAVSLPLVTGAALLARSFVLLNDWTPGFEQEHLATFTTFLPSTSYTGRQDIVRQLDALEREIAAIPGVTGVGTASAGPLFGGRETWQMQVEGRAADDKPSVRWADVSPSFFQTLGIPIVRGRPLGAEDVWGGPSTTLVNETLAHRFWPGQNPVGKRMTFIFGAQHETYTIVGVVRDVPPLATGTSPEPEMYWSNRQAPRPFTYFVVRTSVPPATVANVMRDRVQRVNPSFTINNFATMPELLATRLRSPRFNMSLLTAFGVAALLLAGIGTYGLLAYVVEQRRKDIGIRMALGARREEVIGAVLWDG